jgi:hypothetical protein
VVFRVSGIVQHVAKGPGPAGRPAIRVPAPDNHPTQQRFGVFGLLFSLPRDTNAIEPQCVNATPTPLLTVGIDEGIAGCRASFHVRKWSYAQGERAARALRALPISATPSEADGPPHSLCGHLHAKWHVLSS